MSDFENPAAELNHKPSDRGGPRTPEGKAKSCMNALKTGLTGRTVLLSSDDAGEYEQHLQNFAAEFQPVGQREMQLVQLIADHDWRLQRISALEMSIYASGNELFAEQFADRAPEMARHLIQLQVFMRFDKQLRNLHIQEMRLRRYRDKDTAELQRLQSDRLVTCDNDSISISDAPIMVHVVDRRGQNSAAPALSIKQPRFEFSFGDSDSGQPAPDPGYQSEYLPDAA